MPDRHRFTWGVASSVEEMERVDERWWLALTPAERMALVYELSASFEWSPDERDDELPRRVLGPAAGVRGA